ncbi:MAG: DUF262 domain-containing protein [Lachnospiraceae bacterium]|nr:DUF262 domain-containing protein [Lachnospiraceae bacterium]
MKIGKIFAQDFYAVPDYQRDYEWTNAENSTLLEDLLAIVREPTECSHFFGAIVTIPYEEGNGVNKSVDFEEYGINPHESVKHIVDGQQRLTSFSILIKALRDLIVNDENVSAQFKQNYASRQLDNLLLGNAYKPSGEAAPRLILNGNTGCCYNKEILDVSSALFHKGYKGAKRVMAAYALFFNELSEKKLEFIEEAIVSDAEEYYKRVIDALANKVTFVEIECDASSDAFQVFDSLNGKGLDLTAADRIKNIFMSWSAKGKGAQKWDALVSDIGEEYLANFFVSLFFYTSKKRVAKNRLPDEFKASYRLSAINDFDYFFNQLKEAGILYGKLRSMSTENKELDNILRDFRALNLDQVYVILFAVAHHYGEVIIRTNEYLEFAHALQTLIVRMQICEKSMNKLDSLFTLCIDIMKTGSASLPVITKRIKDEYRSIVDDEAFERAFARFSTTDSRIAEFYLRHIEEFIRKQHDNRSPVERGLTVEHIIPQHAMYDLSMWYGESKVPEEIEDDFKQSVLENIGNKALLYGDDNSSAGSNNYEQKKEVYRTGARGQNKGTPVATFMLINELLDEHPDIFMHDEVKARAQRLAKYAREIWK